MKTTVKKRTKPSYILMSFPLIAFAKKLQSSAPTSALWFAVRLRNVKCLQMKATHEKTTTTSLRSVVTEGYVECSGDF